MDSKKGVSLIILVLAVLVICNAVFVADDSDAASTQTVNVYADVDGSVVHMTGSGTDLSAAIEDAVSSSGYEVNLGAINISSFNGVEASDGKAWTIQQWLPPMGWTVTTFKDAPANFVSGTSYYLYMADRMVDDLNVTYSSPSYKPTSTAYFFIKFVEDVNANSYVTSVLTEEQRLEGFWVSGTGSTAAEAFRNVCTNYGFELNMSDGVKGSVVDPEYIGWLYSFLGLEDINLGHESYQYWSQFYYGSSGWVYGETLGHYDPAVTPYFSLIRQITLEDGVSTDLGVSPSDAPISSINNGCTVRFVDGDGNTIKTQNVSYFGSATAPSDVTKSSSGNTTYSFVGWDTSFSQVISDLTVTAQFTAAGPPVITGVTLSDTTSSLQAGSSYMFKAVVSPSDVEDPSVIWSSSNTSIATVDASGLVTAVAAGSTTITVTTNDGGMTDSVVLKVTPPDGAITLGVTEIVMAVDNSVTLSVNKTVTWRSDNTSIATVDNGTIKAIGQGTVIITAETPAGYSAACKVTVESAKNVSNTVMENTGSDAYAVMLTEDTVRTIVSEGLNYSLETDLGTIALSSEILEHLGSSENMTLSISLFDPSELTGAQKEVVRDSVVYEFLINGSEVPDLGGNAEITLPYSLGSGQSSGDLHVYYVDWRGNVEELDHTYDSESQEIVFQTGHFSLYFISTDTIDSEDDDGGQSSSSNDIMIYAIIAAVIVMILALVAVMMMRHKKTV